MIFEDLPASPEITDRTIEVARGYGRGGTREARLAGAEYELRIDRSVFRRAYDFIFGRG